LRFKNGSDIEAAFPLQCIFYSDTQTVVLLVKARMSNVNEFESVSWLDSYFQALSIDTIYLVLTCL